MVTISVTGSSFCHYFNSIIEVEIFVLFQWSFENLYARYSATRSVLMNIMNDFTGIRSEVEITAFLKTCILFLGKRERERECVCACLKGKYYVLMYYTCSCLLVTTQQ